MTSMRKFTGKKLVSYLRNSDFAHAGECEAIELLFQKYHKDPERTVIDAGCGLGGTASYIQNNQWGRVIGFDFEKEAITYAKQTYPHIEFIHSDVLNIDNLLESCADVVCCFNSFYAFTHQPLALLKLNKITKKNAELALFDYSHPNSGLISPLTREGGPATTPFLPIDIKILKKQLPLAGWDYLYHIELRQQYLKWYRSLIDLLEEKKADIILNFGLELFHAANSTYRNILTALVDNTLSGIAVYAKKI